MDYKIKEIKNKLEFVPLTVQISEFFLNPLFASNKKLHAM